MRIVKPGGFIWKDGAIGTSERLRVELPEMSFDVSGRHNGFRELRLRERLDARRAGFELVRDFELLDRQHRATDVFGCLVPR